MYKLTQDAKCLANGFSRRAGRPINRAEVPPAVFERWLEAGVVVETSPAPAAKPVQQEEPPKKEKQPLAGPPPSLTMTDEELREKAKDLGIDHYWNKSLERLVKEVDEAMGSGW